MCLYIDERQHQTAEGFKPKIDSRDLYTIKAVENYNPKTGQCTSYYKGAYQRIGIKMKSELGVYGYQVEEGLHAMLIESSRSSIGYQAPSIGSMNLICKIPKGSNYYLGEDGDIVSDTMILIAPDKDHPVFDKDSISNLEALRAYCKERSLFTLESSYNENENTLPWNGGQEPRLDLQVWNKAEFWRDLFDGLKRKCRKMVGFED